MYSLSICVFELLTQDYTLSYIQDDQSNETQNWWSEIINYYVDKTHAEFVQSMKENFLDQYADYASVFYTKFNDQQRNQLLELIANGMMIKTPQDPYKSIFELDEHGKEKLDENGNKILIPYKDEKTGKANRRPTAEEFQLELQKIMYPDVNWDEIYQLDHLAKKWADKLGVDNDASNILKLSANHDIIKVPENCVFVDFEGHMQFIPKGTTVEQSKAGVLIKQNLFTEQKINNNNHNI
jgi:hypothetical protein